MRSKVMNCSKCHILLKPDRTHLYCQSCKKEYMKEYNKANRIKHSDFTAEAKVKAITRALTRYYVKQGEVKKEPCSTCGSLKTEAHHNDYSKPKEVVWFCRTHHLQWHRVNDGKIIN